jgi:hypothetical protein
MTMIAGAKTPQAQRMKALERANAIRKARAQLKRRLSAGEISVAELLLDPPPEAVAWPVGELLTSPRGWGVARSRRVLAAHQVKETKPIGQLTARQRHLLVGELDRAMSRGSSPSS